MAEKAPWEEYQEAEDAPWKEYGRSDAKEEKPKAPPPPPPAPKPKREVGFLESAGRTAGQAARTVVGHLGLAAAAPARLLGQDAQDAVFRKRDELLQSMDDLYAPKEGEEFSTAGSLAGGIASAPIEVVGGFGTQHGTERATEVLDRGGTLGDAAVAGGTTAGVRAAMNAVPIKAGGAVGRAIESKLGGLAGGAVTGGTLAAATGSAGRAVENAALPEGQQFQDLEQSPMPQAAEFGLGAVLGAVPGAAAAGSAAVRAAGAKRRAGEAADRARTMKQVETAVDAGVPVAPHQLSGNKFLRYLGEAAEHVPMSGGAANREARARAYSAGLAKAIDPGTDAIKLDDVTFAKLQDSAGERIGEIAARTDVPARSFGNVLSLARRETPDVQQVIQTYAEDLQSIAEQNGGAIPGTTLRKLRTEAQAQARAARASKGDLANALDRLVRRFDDALSEHAPEGDMAALLEARRQYAVSKAIEPLVSKHPDGNFPTQALMTIVSRKGGGGQTRMARGEAGELGDYAEMGAKLIKEQASSGAGERNLIYRVATDALEAGKVLATYPAAALYNAFGPKIVRRMVEKAKRDRQRTQPPPLGESAAQATALGDLTPDWGTSPGAAPDASRVEVVPTDGLEGVVPPPGQLPAAGRIVRSGDPRMQRAEPQMPTVPGRPGLPDTMVAENFNPGDVMADQTTIDAAGTPGAQLARRQQVQGAVDARAASERAEPVPAGQATEIRPEVIDADRAMTMLQERMDRQAKKERDQKVPKGEATELKPETVEGREPEQVDPRIEDIRQLRQRGGSPGMLKALDEAEAEVNRVIKVEKRNRERMEQAAELRRASQSVTDPAIAQLMLERADRVERPAVGVFTDLAKKLQLPEAGVNAALDRARQMRPEEVGAFFQRFVRAMEKRALVKGKMTPEEFDALDDQRIPAGEAKELTPEEAKAAQEPSKPEEKPEVKPAEPEKAETKSQSRERSRIPTITTQAEYDKLPSGAMYRRDGKTFRKK